MFNLERRPDMFEFSGKTMVVTGGGIGIGRALSHRFAREGMRVGIFDVQLAAGTAVADELHAFGTEAAAYQVDITDRNALIRTVAAFEERFGGVDLLCNNSGITTFGKLAALQDYDWDWELAVNLRGAIT
jgi:2-hydroxycyclohexanecarboxyl-CoA dehydrogenase